MAGTFNRYLSKTLKMLDTVTGKNAKAWANRAEVLREAEDKGITALRAKRQAQVEAGRTFQARVKTGVGAAAAVGAGFLGVHKYHQHQDNKILERIDRMYSRQYNTES
jgi:ferric-dicitrate binding protein FerR (iron transport regulator)